MPSKSSTSEYYYSKSITRRSDFAKEHCTDAKAMQKKLQEDLDKRVKSFKESGVDDKAALKNAKNILIGYVVWVVSTKDSDKPCNFLPYFWVDGDSPLVKNNLKLIPASCSKMFLSPNKKLPKKMTWEEFVQDYDIELDKSERGKIFGPRLNLDVPFVPAKNVALHVLRKDGAPSVPRFDPYSVSVIPVDKEDDGFDEDVMGKVAVAASSSSKKKSKAAAPAASLDEDVMDIDAGALPPEEKATPTKSSKKKASSASSSASTSPDKDEAKPTPAKKSKKRKADSITPVLAETFYLPPETVKALLEKHPTISAEVQPLLSQKNSHENLKKFAKSEALSSDSLSALLSMFNGKSDGAFVSPPVLFRILATTMMDINPFIEARIHQHMDQKSERPLATTPEKQIAEFKKKSTIQFFKTLGHLIRLTYAACAGMLGTYAKYESISTQGVVAMKQTKDEAGLAGTKSALRIKDLCMTMTKINYFYIIRPTKGVQQSPARDFNTELMKACNATSMLTETRLVADNSATIMLFYESKDKKSELSIKTFGVENLFKIGDATSSNSLLTIPTVLFHGHPDAVGNLPETPKKVKKVKETKDEAPSSKKEEMPPPETVETVQKQRKPSIASGLLKGGKKNNNVNNHGNPEIIKPQMMQAGKWYRVSSDTLRALGFSKEGDELFVTITPVILSFFKFLESEGKREEVSEWVTGVSSEDDNNDSILSTFFDDEESASFDTSLLQYSILKECITSQLPHGATAEDARVHLNTSSHTLKVIIGKAAPPVDKLKSVSSTKQRGILYLKSEDTIPDIGKDDARCVLIWLSLASFVFGVSLAEKHNADSAVLSLWNKYFKLIPRVEASN